MQQITVLRGGSGRWQGHVGSLAVWGHIPHAAPFQEVCRRQILRQIDGEKPRGDWPGLMGGYLVEIELPDWVMAPAKALAQRRAEERRVAHDAARDRMIASSPPWRRMILCPECGGTGTDACPTCSGSGAVEQASYERRQAEKLAAQEAYMASHPNWKP